MRIFQSPAAWGITIVATFVYFLFLAAAPASATRPIVPPQVDRCSDIAGMQDTASKGYTWRWKVKTPQKGDCRKIALVKVA